MPLDTTSGSAISGNDTTSSFRTERGFHGGACPGARWYAVQAEYRMPESGIAQRIENLGFGVFLPLVAVKRRRGTKREIVNVAMFPSYLFARFDTATEQWRKIAHARGVRRIFGSGPERPIPVPEHSMAWMMARGYDKPISEDPRPSLIAHGAQVKILRGAFADHQGVCVMSGGDRVRLLLDVFGAKREVTVSRSHVVEGV